MTGTEGWVIGNKLVKEELHAEGNPYIPSFTANNEANEIIFNEIYESVNPRIDEAIALLSEMVNYAKYRPQTPIGQEFNDALNEAIRNAYLGTDPAEALAAAEAQVQRSLDEFYKNN